jgi:hypothetical protein
MPQLVAVVKNVLFFIYILTYSQTQETHPVLGHANGNSVHSPWGSHLPFRDFMESFHPSSTQYFGMDHLLLTLYLPTVLLLIHPFYNHHIPHRTQTKPTARAAT